MTFPPSDSPDWTGIPGGVRYLGTINLSGTGGLIQGNLAFSPASYDGAIYVVFGGDPSSTDQDATITLTCVTLGQVISNYQYYLGALYGPDPFVGFVSAVLGANWQVAGQIVNANGSTWQLHVFAVPSYPLARIVRNQSPLPAGAIGYWRKPYDSVLLHTPAANVLATVTFPATANRRWVLDHAVWTLRNTAAAAAAVSIEILDGAVTIWRHALTIQAVVNAVDRMVLPSELGIASTAANGLTVRFAAAGGATTVESVTAGAYLLPTNG